MTEMMERYEKENGRKPYFLGDDGNRAWRESFVFMLGQEISTLRSLTRWHYAPEVPSESGQYYGKFAVATSCSYKHVCYYTKGDEEPWSHQWLDENGVTELHDAPIAWAFLPEEEK